MSFYAPHHFQMQWHITQRCNLRCGHCYQNGFDEPDVTFVDLLRIFEQFLDTVRVFSEKRNRPIPARITLTGGEPFLRPDFFELLQRIASQGIASQRNRVSFAILTNGTLIDDEKAKRLASLKPDYVQISIDGMRETHDALRAPGSWDQAVRGVKILRRYNIRTILSFTASRANVGEFENVALLGKELGVQRIWADRLIPTSPRMREQVLSPSETKAFFEAMGRAREKLRPKIWYQKMRQRLFVRNSTEVSMHRALQFLVGGGPIYRCTAGRSLVAVLPDGTLLPCRRLPIPAGNLFHTPLLELYENDDIMRKLREPFSRPFCGGGLRCLSYALTGDPLVCDPGCWILCDKK